MEIKSLLLGDNFSFLATKIKMLLYDNLLRTKKSMSPKFIESLVMIACINTNINKPDDNQTFAVPLSKLKHVERCY